jgi:hypothetical protein
MTKRGFLAAAAAALFVLALVPGAAGAFPLVPGDLDQHVGDSGSVLPIGTQGNAIQTFTAGKTGLLTYVSLPCMTTDQGQVISLSVAVGTASATSACTFPGGWTRFVFDTPPEVVTGTQYAMTFTGGEYTESSAVWLTVAGSSYAGGSFSEAGMPVGGIDDVAFETFVQPAPTLTYTWDPSQVTAGTYTDLTITIVADFPGAALPNVASVNRPAPATTDSYIRMTDGFPADYDATGVVCSAEIAPADCTFNNLFLGMPFYTGGNGATITITVSGHMTLPAMAHGTLTVGATACATLPFEAGTVQSCGVGRGALTIGAPAPTPPSTTTVAGSSSDRSVPLPLWPIAALFVTLTPGLFLLAKRSRS